MSHLATYPGFRFLARTCERQDRGIGKEHKRCSHLQSSILVKVTLRLNMAEFQFPDFRTVSALFHLSFAEFPLPFLRLK
jgi:hypothetical protein